MGVARGAVQPASKKAALAASDVARVGRASRSPGIRPSNRRRSYAPYSPAFGCVAFTYGVEIPQCTPLGKEHKT